jgi:MFS family permease
MKTFVRDRFTWLAYFMLAYYAYGQSILGPIVPFLRDELRLNYTVSAFHLSAFAIGMMLSGLTADRFAHRWGRRIVFWGGGAGLAVGAILLGLGQNVFVTIASSFIMGFIGSLLLVMIQATLSEHYGNQRAIALTEANIAAAVAATLSPILVGVGVSIGIGWQSSLYVCLLAWGILALLFWRVPLPGSHSTAAVSTVSESPSRESLPRVFWAYWIVVFLSVAIEWCMIFWAADFMEKVGGLSKEASASALSIFFLAVVIGRAAGSGLARKVDSGTLLLIATVIVLIGFPVFWLSRTPLFIIVGLFICGLGTANLFPLTLSTAAGIAPSNLANTASARISLGSGTAILIVPQVLGSAADQIGIQNAYGIILVFAGLAAAMTYYANRMAKQPVELARNQESLL